MTYIKNIFTVLLATLAFSAVYRLGVSDGEARRHKEWVNALPVVAKEFLNSSCHP